jgi:hypothetical protein
VSGPCLSSSVPDHPLRPGTRRRLGEPLPHQLADRPRANPVAAAYATFTLAGPWGINPPFGGLSPSTGHVTHVLRTRAPLSETVLLQLHSVRLACLKHAASVRSEPESNSP